MATKGTTQKKNKSNNTKVEEKKKNSKKIEGTKKVDSNKKKNNKKVSNIKKKKNKKVFIKKYKIDILDVLLIIVFTVIASSFVTGYIFNYQYKRNRTLNETLLYSESFSKLAQVFDEVKKNYYEKIDEEELSRAALDGMLGYLGDKYSIYLTDNDSEELSTSLDGEYKGIGVVCSLETVIFVYDGSPASNAGIQVGDKIVSINGESITKDNAQTIGELIKKDKNNSIEVSRDGSNMTFDIKVDTVVVPSVSGDVLSKDNNNVGYVKISSFSSNTYSQFVDELKKIEDKEVNSLIIDLRNNTGGYLSAAYDIANVFLKSGDVVYSLESQDEIKVYKDTTKDSKNVNVIILINGGTASASEVLASALKDSYGAIIVGEQSYGKGKVQTLLTYGNSLVKYTSAKWLRPNGECVDEIGIKPDYEVSNTVKGNTIYDNQLELALKIANEKEK